MAMLSLFLTGFQGNGIARAAVPVVHQSAPEGIQALAADGASFYYYADGQRISLQPSLKWVSVKFVSTETAKQSSVLQNSATSLGSLDQARHIPTPELTLLPVQAGTTVQSLTQSINAMRATPSSFQAVNPVFQMDDVEMVPTDQFIATFPAEKSLEEINALNASLGAEIVEPLLGQENTFVLKVLPAAGSDALAMANFYQESGAALNAAPNFVRITQASPEETAAAQPTAAGPLAGTNDQWYGDQWFLNETNQYGSFMNGADADIDAPEAWAKTTGSSAVIIAIIDEGVDRTHEDLSAKMVPGYDATGLGSGGSPQGNDAHGTAAAGVAAAKSNNTIGVAGVCQNCLIMPVRIAYEDVNGNWVTTDATLANGITWAYQNGAWILNNSWRAGPPSTAITAAISNAKTQGRGGRGSVVVFSAGNDNVSTVSYPASLDTVISVGALNMCSQRKIPATSTMTTQNQCNGFEPWGSSYGTGLDIAAPGVWLTTTDIMGAAGYSNSATQIYGANYTGFFNGTSGAAPVVSGVAGLVLSANPYLSADEVQTILQNNADDVSPAGWDVETGYGRVNANRAVQGALAAFVRDTAGVFRPSNGALYLKNSNNTGFADVAINYGLPGDYPVVGDWDGNGTATIGIYRNGTFYLRNSNTIGFADIVAPFGAPGDQPVAGDWNNDGVDTIGVFRNGTFYLRNSNTAGAPELSFGLGNPGDVGIAGDWNGDGTDTTGVFRPSNGVIFLKNTNTTGFADIALNYGLPGDKPVTGDWNNDGIDTIGVDRNGQFLLRNSNTVGFAEIVFTLGISGDVPIAGNWDATPYP
jgi:subtilisin family serine protease